MGIQRRVIPTQGEVSGYRKPTAVCGVFPEQYQGTSLMIEDLCVKQQLHQSRLDQDYSVIKSVKT